MFATSWIQVSMRSACRNRRANFFALNRLIQRQQQVSTGFDPLENASVKLSEPGNEQDTLSEWLRRWTRNPLGSARRGSNPLAVDKSQLRCHRWHFLAQRISRLQKSMLSCGASKHHSSRAPAFRNPVVDCWANHARVVTPVGSL